MFLTLHWTRCLRRARSHAAESRQQQAEDEQQKQTTSLHESGPYEIHVKDNSRQALGQLICNK